MTRLTRRFHTIAGSISRSPSRGARVNGWIADVTFCDGCGQVCTAGCRSAARFERSRAQAFQFAPIR